MATTGLQIEAPRSPRRQRATNRTNFEMYAWVFMRLSGLLLVGLVFTHLFVNAFIDGGVQRISFAFVAGKYASPFWQVFDLALLWLAQLHGTNGLRVIINDYAERDGTRFWLKMLLYTTTTLIIALGTLVIFTFDPNIS
ncbi:succinate dehydrogenase hydrophobic membrane anchor subunit [Cryptosporangium minutisporangium]|uniref:Succinate dehydrogenase hydrophobic membrane anchor subunit n=1 Tax=Cryptosporangium minutisporangium TaxID=113569 RepID=A0ABP6T3A7_9ACTN